MPEASSSSPLEAARRESCDCRPASPRDWLAAQTQVRLGRLNRFAAIRAIRDKLVRFLAREGAAVLFLTPFGFQILLPATYTSLIITALDRALFHPALLELSRRVIRAGDIVVDGGSNVGFFALFAARLLGGNGRVFAFEPDPESFLLLRRNVESNGLTGAVQLEEKALTDANGSSEFSVSVQEPMLSSLVARTDIDSRVIRVQGVRLDDYFAMNGVRKADVIKLDLEGAEPQALDGMTSILASARLIIFEVNEPQFAEIGVDPVTFITRTAMRGAFDTILFIDERSDQICGWEPDKFKEALHAYKYVNVLCAKRGAISPLPYAVSHPDLGPQEPDKARQKMTDPQKNLPSVSVVVPTRGRPGFLRNCLESLIRLDYPRELYEIIVIEDGTESGEKETSEIARLSPVPVHYHRIPHSGAATSRNVGLSRSSKDIVAFIDDDATAIPEWLTRLVVALSSTGVGGAGGRVSPDYPDAVLEAEMLPGGEMKWSGYNSVPPGLQEVDHLPGGNMAFWRKALVEVAGLDTEYTRRGSWREDTDLCVRLRHKGYRLIYDGEARISHRAVRWIGASERFRPGLVWAMTRDDAYFRVKNYGWGGVTGTIREAAKNIKDRIVYGGANFLLISVHLVAWIPGVIHGLRRKNNAQGSLRQE